LTAAIVTSYGGSADRMDQIGTAHAERAGGELDHCKHRDHMVGKPVGDLPTRKCTEAKTEHKSGYHDGDRLYVDTEALK
jgi:hypothetical protein